MVTTKKSSSRSRWHLVMASILVSLSVLLTVGPVAAGGSADDTYIDHYVDGFKHIHRFSSKDDFFEKVVNSDSIWLVQFYAPWDDYEFECEACGALAPVFSHAATTLRGIVQFGVVDAATKGRFGRNIAFRYFEKQVDIISGYPKILFFGFNKKKPSQYQGDTDTSRPIISFALNQIGDVVTRRVALSNTNITGVDPDELDDEGNDLFDLQTVTEHNPILIITEDSFSATITISVNKVYLLAFVAPWDIHSKKLLPHYARASHLLKNSGATLAVMDATINEKFTKQFGVNSFPTIMTLSLMQSDDEDDNAPKISMVEYEGGHTVSEISKYVYDAVEQNDATPDILQLTSEQILQDTCLIKDGVTDESVFCAITVLPPISKTKAKGRNKYLSSIQKVKKRFQGQFIQFLWIESFSQPDLEHVFGLSTLPHPTTVVISIEEGNQKYMIQPAAKKGESFSATNMLRFVKSCLVKNKANPLDMDELPAIYDTEPWNGLDAPGDNNDDDYGDDYDIYEPPAKQAQDEL